MLAHPQACLSTFLLVWVQAGWSGVDHWVLVLPPLDLSWPVAINHDWSPLISLVFTASQFGLIG